MFHTQTIPCSLEAECIYRGRTWQVDRLAEIVNNGRLVSQVLQEAHKQFIQQFDVLISIDRIFILIRRIAQTISYEIRLEFVPIILINN